MSPLRQEKHTPPGGHLEEFGKVDVTDQNYPNLTFENIKPISVRFNYGTGSWQSTFVAQVKEIVFIGYQRQVKKL